MNRIGNILRIIREINGYRIDEVASKCNINKNTINKLENNYKCNSCCIDWLLDFYNIPCRVFNNILANYRNDELVKVDILEYYKSVSIVNLVLNSDKLGCVLKTIRSYLNITFLDIKDDLGISIRHLRELENSFVRCDYELNKLLDYYNMDYNFFFDICNDCNCYCIEDILIRVIKYYLNDNLVNNNGNAVSDCCNDKVKTLKF